MGDNALTNLRKLFNIMRDGGAIRNYFSRKGQVRRIPGNIFLAAPIMYHSDNSRDFVRNATLFHG